MLIVNFENMTIVIGIIAIIVGALAVIYTEWIVANFGVSDWAEAKLSGGSRLFYKLMGILLIIVSLVVMTGMGEQILLGTFGQLFGI